MRPVPKKVAVTFLLAAAGVVFLLVLVVKILLGLVAVAALAVAVVALLGMAVRNAKRRRARLAAGRTCTCCTGTVHDPVQVI